MPTNTSPTRPRLPQNPHQHLAHPIRIAQHVIIAEPHHAITGQFQHRRPSRIPRRAVIAVMTTTINFEDQLLALADKVGDIDPDWRLPPKVPAAASPRIQQRPEPPLGIGLLPPQPPRHCHRIPHPLPPADFHQVSVAQHRPIGKPANTTASPMECLPLKREEARQCPSQNAPQPRWDSSPFQWEARWGSITAHRMHELCSAA